MNELANQHYLKQYGMLGSQQASQYQQYQQGAAQGSLGGLADAGLANQCTGAQQPRLPIVQYEAARDELIPVTQAWVDEAKQTISKLYREREEARAEIKRLKGPDEAKIEFGELNKKTPWVSPIEGVPEQDRMWQAVRMAASC